MTPKQFSNWNHKMGFNYISAPAMLGIDKKTYYNYLNGVGKKGIPQYIDLACAAIAAGLTLYSEGKK